MTVPVWEWFSEPLSLDFMQRAMVSALALGIAAPLAGVWATHRGLVYLTDAMSHAVLSGVAAASLLGFSLLLGGVVSAVVMALLVSGLLARTRLSPDSAIGVSAQGLFALGVIGVSLGSDPRTLSHVLFGNPLTVSAGDVALQGGLAAVVVLLVVVFLPVLTATTFDPSHARSLGINATLLDSALVLGLGLVVVVGMTTVGVLMAVTLCVAPAAAAQLLARTLNGTLILAVVLGVCAGFGGLLFSYHLAVPAGPAVAVVAVATVAACGALQRLRPSLSSRPQGVTA
ncbi:hypothetical protein BIU82_13465 [Arthrobacter sp. SW1]|uniref:metal ABC transporter permease n=1 Tax=Arthrobacter sp. SW1 TaxID=1920889 RepID=UPI000877B059|nr:metal ABC transporter permease [Arthrobacter sp. SW1]OFI36501.1 hypothetical protein BIU82_13465 [Arthrobacter sp. SW1]